MKEELSHKKSQYNLPIRERSHNDGMMPRPYIDSPLMQSRLSDYDALFSPSQPNRTGLPDDLKNGMENSTGMDLDLVNVHYDSNKPAEFQSHAYAQGYDIYLASGQEQHLPHELGHVVQQMRGQVQPNSSVGGMAMNDDVGLESEATWMGDMALQRTSKHDNKVETKSLYQTSSITDDRQPIQRVIKKRLTNKDVEVLADKQYAHLLSSSTKGGGVMAKIMEYNVMRQCMPEEFSYDFWGKSEFTNKLLKLHELPNDEYDYDDLAGSGSLAGIFNSINEKHYEVLDVQRLLTPVDYGAADDWTLSAAMPQLTISLLNGLGAANIATDTIVMAVSEIVNISGTVARQLEEKYKYKGIVGEMDTSEKWGVNIQQTVSTAFSTLNHFLGIDQSEWGGVDANNDSSSFVDSAFRGLSALINGDDGRPRLVTALTIASVIIETYVHGLVNSFFQETGDQSDVEAKRSKILLARRIFGKKVKVVSDGAQPQATIPSTYECVEFMNGAELNENTVYLIGGKGGRGVDPVHSASEFYASCEEQDNSHVEARNNMALQSISVSDDSQINDSKAENDVNISSSSSAVTGLYRQFIDLFDSRLPIMPMARKNKNKNKNIKVEQE